MKYEQHIDAAFERLGFTPRPGQKEAADQVLTAFVDENMQNVILNASTGTGKSIIGAVVAEALTSAKGCAADTVKSSISLTATNVLAKQYGETFSSLEKSGKYIMIKGASNYECSVLSEPANPETADACAWVTMVQAGSEFEDTISTHCNKCEYLATKKKKNTVRHLTTNYSYFFVDRMYTGKFEDRDLIVWDEAHLINDLFSEHNAIHFSQKRLQAMAKEIAETIHLTDVQIAKQLSSITADCGKKDKINDSNYKSYLAALQKIYIYAKEQGTQGAATAMRSGQMKTYTKLSRFAKKYEGLSCKIDDLFKFDYPHVFEWKEQDAAVSVKPVFVSKMMEELQCSAHNLFMSATISDAFMVKTLDLVPERTKFIKLPPTFSKDNKEVIFFDPMSLNYTSLQNPDTVKQLRKNVAKIVKKHIDAGDRGIILAPSFKLQSELVSELQAQSWAKNYRLFEQRQGEKLEHTLAAFKQYKGGPAVLISPAMFEGIDLPGELSRFQILVKAPFPNLGDRRMKFILDHHPDLYSLITLMKAVQGAGRSVRSADDFATTYCLDKNLERLWGSRTNLWSDEFNTRYTKFLM